MTKDYKASSRYARAFFLMTRVKTREQAAYEDLFRIREFSKTHPEFSRILLTTMISDEEKFELIENLLEGLAGPETRNFMKLLVEKNRFNLFEGICAKFRELFYAARGIEEARLVTAYALAPEEREPLAEMGRGFGAEDEPPPKRSDWAMTRASAFWRSGVVSPSKVNVRLMTSGAAAAEDALACDCWIST